MFHLFSRCLAVRSGGVRNFSTFRKEYITSKRNEKVKFVNFLQGNRRRKEELHVVVEGHRQIIDLLTSQCAPSECFITDRAVSAPFGRELMDKLNNTTTKVLFVTDDVMNFMSDTSQSQGVLALFARPQLVHSLVLPGDNFPPRIILICDEVSDPGNLGTLIRTAYGAGVNVLITIRGVDPYSPKVIRSSMGLSILSALIPPQTNSADASSDTNPGDTCQHIGAMKVVHVRSWKGAKELLYPAIDTGKIVFADVQPGELIGGDDECDATGGGSYQFLLTGALDSSSVRRTHQTGSIQDIAVCPYYDVKYHTSGRYSWNSSSAVDVGHSNRPGPHEGTDVCNVDSSEGPKEKVSELPAVTSGTRFASTVVIMGSEANGVSCAGAEHLYRWCEEERTRLEKSGFPKCNAHLRGSTVTHIHIPLMRKLESFNVAVAASMICGSFTISCVCVKKVCTLPSKATYDAHFSCLSTAVGEIIRQKDRK